MNTIVELFPRNETDRDDTIEFEGVDKYAVRENGVLAIRLEDGDEIFYADGAWRSIAPLADDEDSEDGEVSPDAS